MTPIEGELYRINCEGSAYHGATVICVQAPNSKPNVVFDRKDSFVQIPVYRCEVLFAPNDIYDDVVFVRENQLERINETENE